MKEIDRYLLNKVHIFLAECYENKTIIPPESAYPMFGKIFKRDAGCLQHCPEGLENSLKALIKDIYTNPSESFKQSLKILLTSYYDTIRYERVKTMNIPISEKDKYWMKALLSEFVLQNLLYKNNTNDILKEFNEEYAQIGSLVRRYYTEDNASKLPIVRNMIKAKMEDIYKRYNYKYDLPALCA